MPDALQRKLRRHRPGIIAFLGVTAYRTAFQRPDAKLGKQEECLGDVPIWVLPNPSGLNAHFQLGGSGGVVCGTSALSR